jgi:hypothetical protein
MQTTVNAVSEKDRAYRRRLAEAGQHQLIIALPRETVAFLDELPDHYK